MPRLANLRLPLAAAALCALAAPLHAQAWRAAPSSRASATVTLNPPRGAPAETKPAQIKIDYGQPHARGREVAGALAGDLDKIWRLGANEATSFVTDVDLVLGTLTVPRGEYTLYTQTSRNGTWQLIVSRKTKQWGTEYDAKQDLGRVPLRARTLATPLESLVIWLIPSGDGSPKGELRFAWGSREFAVDWRVK